MRILAALLFCWLLTMPLKAAQVGGEIIYADQGGGNYLVTLKLYRDCFNSPQPYDNPAKISVYDASGAFVDSLLIAFTSSAPVPPTFSNPCFSPPASICVDVATYTATITLTPQAGGYYLVYQRCCRTSSILNINNPGGTGSTYIEHIPGPEVAGSNSSPYFTGSPPTFFCDGVPLSYNFTATDPDGDSLVYQLCSPYAGLDPCCPLLAATAPNTGAPGCVNPPAQCPERGQAPPYASVSYVPPYTGSFPMSSNPAVQLNPQTGLLTGVPNITGQWAVAVCVREYRNGVLLGTHSLDFQFNVINCPNLIQSSILPQQQLCTGFTLSFTNLSSGGVGYSWNFGDASTLADTSNQQNPSYTFPDTGMYVVTLITLGPNPGCNDTTTEVFYVYEALNPSFVPPPGQCIAGNSYNFTAGGQFAPYASFYWDFSSWATPANSTQQNPNGISYNQYGSFPVTITVNQKSCTKSYTDTVQVYPNTVTQFQQDSFSGCQPLAVNFTNTSLYGGATTFTWYFGNGDSLNAVDADYVYQDTGTFNITLVSTTSVGCVGTGTATANGLVTVFPGPKAGFIANPTFTNIYNPNISFTDTSVNATVQLVQMGDGSSFTSLPPGYSYAGYGTYVVTQIAVSSNGCSDTARQTIIIDRDFTFYVPSSFSPNGDAHNERFRVVSFGVYDYSITIFDRWGHEVFYSEDPEESWDGNWGGKKCPQDVYVYKAGYTPVTDPYPRRHTGVIHLVR